MNIVAPEGLSSEVSVDGIFTEVWVVPDEMVTVGETGVLFVSKV